MKVAFSAIWPDSITHRGSTQVVPIPVRSKGCAGGGVDGNH